MWSGPMAQVSFQALGFYSPQKLSREGDAMKVMEAYMASYWDPLKGPA